MWCRARTRRVLADKLVRTIRRDQWLNLNEEKVRLYDPGESNGVGGKSGVAAGGASATGWGADGASSGADPANYSIKLQKVGGGRSAGGDDGYAVARTDGQQKVGAG